MSIRAAACAATMKEEEEEEEGRALEEPSELAWARLISRPNKVKGRKCNVLCGRAKEPPELARGAAFPGAQKTRRT